METRPTTTTSEDSATPASSSDEVADPTAVEFTTVIRGRSVSCRWEAGRLAGDQELLDRVARMPAREGWSNDVSSVAAAIEAAVGHPVTIRLLGAG